MAVTCICKFKNYGLYFMKIFGPNKTVTNEYATEITLETEPYRLHKLDDAPSRTVTVNREDALGMYDAMYTIRRLENAVGNLYAQKIIRGFCHLYTGQEAVAVGIKFAMRPQDAVITSYRAHGWVYLMGVSMVGLLAELSGFKSGCSRGKGGSMHTYGDNFYGGNGIVGAQVPLGVGIALSAQYRKTNGVCVALYGDGAANQGQVAEVFNMSKLWDLPCIFVCENNRYGMGTSSKRSSANMEYYTRGDPIPGIRVDGMDVLAMREAAKFAIHHCTSGKGPIVLEAATYRFHGHSVSDPGSSYRTREEVQHVRETQDPIATFKNKIITKELATAEELTKIDDDIKAKVDEAVKQVKKDTEIDIGELVGDIYCSNLHSNIRNILPFKPLQHKQVRNATNVTKK